MEVVSIINFNRDGDQEDPCAPAQPPDGRRQLLPSCHLRLLLRRVLHQVQVAPSRTTYQQIGHRNKDSQVKNVLDIGTATGGPLLTIVDCFKQARVLGIDYNSHYIPACKKLFRDHTNVDIKQMNFYDLELEEPETLFDVIIFGSSFMILPDQTKALEIATRKVCSIQVDWPKEARFTFC